MANNLDIAQKALKEALKAAGGQHALARAINAIDPKKLGLASIPPITGQAINQWDRVPQARVLQVELVTKVPRWRLRPDFYPPEKQKKRA